jgi:hypothetical protein
MSVSWEANKFLSREISARISAGVGLLLFLRSHFSTLSLMMVALDDIS